MKSKETDNECTHCWHGDGGSFSENESVMHMCCCFCNERKTEITKHSKSQPKPHGPFHPGRQHIPAGVVWDTGKEYIQ